MPSLNRIYLIGVVGRPPVVDAGQWRLQLVIPDEGSGRLRVERVEVVGGLRLADVVSELRTAQLVYLEGRLDYSPTGPVVTAATVFSLVDASVPDPAAAPTGRHHASPTPHERAGHPRTLHRGTARERVVWVRPTSVAAHPHTA